MKQPAGWLSEEMKARGPDFLARENAGFLDLFFRRFYRCYDVPSDAWTAGQLLLLRREAKADSWEERTVWRGCISQRLARVEQTALGILGLDFAGYVRKPRVLRAQRILYAIEHDETFVIAEIWSYARVGRAWCLRAKRRNPRD